MMEANQNNNSVATADVVNDLAAAVLVSDICLGGCSRPLPEDSKMVLVKIPTKRGDRTYPFIAIFACQDCCTAMDYNKTKKTIGYWLAEGKLEVLKDV